MRTVSKLTVIFAIVAILVTSVFGGTVNTVKADSPYNVVTIVNSTSGQVDSFQDIVVGNNSCSATIFAADKVSISSTKAGLEIVSFDFDSENNVKVDETTRTAIPTLTKTLALGAVANDLNVLLQWSGDGYNIVTITDSKVHQVILGKNSCSATVFAADKDTVYASQSGTEIVQYKKNDQTNEITVDETTRTAIPTLTKTLVLGKVATDLPVFIQWNLGAISGDKSCKFNIGDTLYAQAAGVILRDSSGAEITQLSMNAKLMVVAPGCDNGRVWVKSGNLVGSVDINFVGTQTAPISNGGSNGGGSGNNNCPTTWTGAYNNEMGLGGSASAAGTWGIVQWFTPANASNAGAYLTFGSVSLASNVSGSVWWLPGASQAEAQCLLTVDSVAKKFGIRKP